MIPSYIIISFFTLHSLAYMKSQEILGNELKINFARLNLTFSYKLIEIKRKGSTLTKKKKPQLI